MPCINQQQYDPPSRVATPRSMEMTPHPPSYLGHLLPGGEGCVQHRVAALSQGERVAIPQSRESRVRGLDRNFRSRLISTVQPDRRRLSQGLIASSIVLVAFLLLGAQSLHGQADALFINQQGNVGIGTKTLGFPLTFANEPLGDRISLYGQTPGVSFGFGIQGDLLQIHTNRVEADVAFGYGSSASFKEIMRIKGNGNVGIGTTNPSNPLVVQGNDNNYLKMLLISNTNTGANAHAGIQMTQGSNTGYIIQQGTNYWLWNNANGPMIFVTNGTKKMTVGGDGNVGIGTDDPKAKLHVTGDENVTGRLTVGNMVVQNGGMIQGKLWISKS